MTGSNHVVMGALVGALVAQPIIAIPLAFFSHFVLDALPHYGHEHDERYWLTKNYRRVLVADALLTTSLFLYLLLVQPQNWGLMFVCAAVAVLPDALWIPYYLHDLKYPESKQRRPLSRLLKKIQLGERPWGIYVELVFLAIILSILFNNIS